MGNLIILENLRPGLTNGWKVLRGVSEGYWLGEFDNFRKSGTGLTHEREVFGGVSEGYWLGEIDNCIFLTPGLRFSSDRELPVKMYDSRSP